MLEIALVNIKTIKVTEYFVSIVKNQLARFWQGSAFYVVNYFNVINLL